ncbi:hypothetical protein HELRODRAFT_194636 [Helobdella robusta]|uniref:2-(3-amino-3-carboxypropyl)histidine synthase subunit 2 n=1 Tax=Helobdella robusta TaxID=6412 RepID=T1FW94_HELRO|nr:hypothetical protein HELRODRAFT_194636 [Helobdella robusta]ESN90848.1 hypothetical protein HELRODRAFT_194636 [Helobdella robusta]
MDLFYWRFDIESSVRWITENNFQRVALQFCEDLYKDSIKIYLEIKNKLPPSTELAIIADNKYNSCCLDEINAEHLRSDCLIHYGEACFSPNSYKTKFPVKYVFPKKSLNLSTFGENLKKFMTKNPEEMIATTRYVVVYGLAYHYLRDEITSCFKELNVLFHCPIIEEYSADDGDNQTATDEHKFHQHFVGRNFKFSAEDRKTIKIIYIGGEDSFITSLLMRLNECSCAIYKVEEDSFVDGWSCNKLLKKRYYMVEKARDANFIGIIVSTFSNFSTQVIEKLKTSIRQVGKRYRIYSPGSLNPAKLANVSEFDAFVYVSCPLNAFIDCSDYLQPIVTPYEMLLACKRTFAWTGDYLLDLGELARKVNADDDDTLVGDVTMDVSLITGRTRKIGLGEYEQQQQQQRHRNNKNNNKRSCCHGDESCCHSDEDGDVKEIACLGSRSIAAQSSYGEHWSARSWRGLEMKLGETDVVAVVDGCTGIPTSYQHECKQ